MMTQRQSKSKQVDFNNCRFNKASTLYSLLEEVACSPFLLFLLARLMSFHFPANFDLIKKQCYVFFFKNGKWLRKMIVETVI